MSISGRLKENLGCRSLRSRCLSLRLRGETSFIGLDFGTQTILGGLGRIRTLRTEEIVDVCSQHVGVGQHDVVRSVVLSCGVDDFLGILEVAGQESFDLLQDVGSLLSLC